MALKAVTNVLTGAVEFHVVPASAAAETAPSGDPHDDIDDGAGSASILHSTYADMLHDEPRNQFYAQALQAAVAQKPQALVLDIGTGSGLLALLALQAGAKTVVACEVSPALQRIADQCFARNKVPPGASLTLVRKRSTSMVVGEDLPRPADIIVCEIFDSCVLGEGVLPTLRHALSHLAAPDALVVPAAATIYAQPWTGPTLWACHNAWNLPSAGQAALSLETAPCAGAPFPLEVQMTPAGRGIADSWLPLGQPVVVEHFDWDQLRAPSLATGHTAEQDDEAAAALVRHTVDVPWPASPAIDLSSSSHLPTIHGVVMSWRLYGGAPAMDFWMGPAAFSLPEAGRQATASASFWREHWRPALYFVPRPLDLRCDAASETPMLRLIAVRDDHCWSFDLQPQIAKAPPALELSRCESGAHAVFSRPHLQDLHLCSSARSATIAQAVQAYAATRAHALHCLCIGDASLDWDVLAAMPSDVVATIVCCQPHRLSREVSASICLGLAVTCVGKKGGGGEVEVGSAEDLVENKGLEV